MTEAYPSFHSPMRCQPELDYTHATIARAYALPVISFMRAVCNDSATVAQSNEPTERHWRAGCSHLDSPGEACAPHPGPHTHTIYASLLARYILSQAAAAGAARSASSRAGAPAASGTLSIPEGPAPQGKGPFILKASELSALQGCSEPITSMETRKSCTLPRLSKSALCKRSPQSCSVSSPGWDCYEDRPGKPGWIANATTGGVLAVRVRATVSGSLVIGYLRSYEGMGNASLIVDENKSMAVTIRLGRAHVPDANPLDSFPQTSLQGRREKEVG